MLHHRNRLRQPRLRWRSDSGSAAIFGDQMMPAIFSGDGARVSSDTITIAVMQVSHTMNVRFSQLSNGRKKATCLKSTCSTSQV